MKLREIYGRDPYENSQTKNIKGSEVVYYVEKRSPGKVMYRVRLESGKMPPKDAVLYSFEATYGGKVSGMNKDKEFNVTIYTD